MERIKAEPGPNDWAVDNRRDDELLKGVVANLGTPMRPGHWYSFYRWVLVCEFFGVGEVHAKRICDRFGFDPDEKIIPRKVRP